MKIRMTAFKCFHVAAIISLVLLALASASWAEIRRDSPEEEALQAFMNQTAPHEYRGMWITRFEWPSTDEEECKEKIADIMETLAKANFNLALFQVRGSCEVFYPSPIEPWAGFFGGKDPGFDPLEIAVKEAHKRGIELHAYINPIPLCDSRTTPSSDTEPLHLYWRHGPDSEEPWICMDKDGKPMSTRGAGYWYLSPNIPAVQSYLREVIRDLVSRYEIDGLHLDRIRFPGPEYSHDPVSRRRFPGRGNPNLKEWADWQREQLDKFVNDVCAEAKAIRPNIVVSCAAWGIYNRYNVKGYYDFSSGYHDYYQDTWNWVRLGAMDMLVPMIYWNLEDRKPNYDEMVDDFTEGVGASRFLGGQTIYRNDPDIRENMNQVLYGRKAGIPGSVFFAYNSAKRSGLFDKFRETVYREEAEIPPLESLRPNDTGIIMGIVQEPSGQPVEDAWVSIKPSAESEADSRTLVFRKTWTSGADGRFAFLNVPPGKVDLTVNYVGAPPVTTTGVRVEAGKITDLRLDIRGVGYAREGAFVNIIRPKDGDTVFSDKVHILGRTNPENRISINNQDVPVFSTGAFALDNIPLLPGENRIRLTAVTPEDVMTSREILLISAERPVKEEEAGIKILEPSQDMSILPGDVLEIRARGPLGMTAEVSLFEGRQVVPLTESANEDHDSTGIYSLLYRVPSGVVEQPSPAIIRMKAAGSEEWALEAASTGKIEIWDGTKVRVGEATEDGTAITFGTHTVRLGGPYLVEMPEGTRFEVIGRQGERYRIRLSSSLTGWVTAKFARILPDGTPLPQAMFTSFTVSGDEQYDKIWFPMKEKVIVAITPEYGRDIFLQMDFFNTHFAATWISHKTGAQVIGTVTGRQMEDGRFRVTVPLRGNMIWGYWLEREENGNLVLCVRRPPALAPRPESALKGLKIAIEAGHGGSGSGAVGFMGTNEKTVNTMAVKATRKVLEERGAEVVEVRPGDSNPSLGERTEMAFQEGCHFYLSIHANAAGTDRGFLRVSGTSTYFRDPQNEPAARYVYDNLLKLGWDEFGVVGNFHYYPLRDTRMPSMLVEQAFMSHPGDEARLLDPEYQREQALAIVDGMEKFLDSLR